MFYVTLGRQRQRQSYTSSPADEDQSNAGAGLKQHNRYKNSHCFHVGFVHWCTWLPIQLLPIQLRYARVVTVGATIGSIIAIISGAALLPITSDFRQGRGILLVVVLGNWLHSSRLAFVNEPVSHQCLIDAQQRSTHLADLCTQQCSEDYIHSTAARIMKFTVGWAENCVYEKSVTPQEGVWR